LRGAADPSLVALDRPVVGDVFDGLVEVSATAWMMLGPRARDMAT
jgi:hypothetical protein